jgi:hypothetical protein
MAESQKRFTEPLCLFQSEVVFILIAWSSRKRLIAVDGVPGEILAFVEKRKYVNT